MTTQPWTVERVRAVLGECPALTAEDWEELAAQATADPGEGAEWLPAYKVALGVLAVACGMLDGALDGVIAAGTLPPLKAANLERIRAQAHQLFCAHLRACGVGPDPTPERVADVEAAIRGELEKAEG